MDIVLENPTTAPPTSASPQLGLPTTLRPMHPQHFPSHRALYDADLGRRSPGTTLPTEDYNYARSCHPASLALPYVGDRLDVAPAPVTVRRVDKSGLLEIADADPCGPRPCVLTGAEDVRPSLRVDRSGLLEAVPEAADQLEEHCGDATTMPLDEAAAISRREPPLRANDVNLFDGHCLLERPSSLEGQACPDEANGMEGAKVLDGSSRVQLDVSSATERLTHLQFSPGLTLRRSRNDLPARRSPLINRCAPKSPEVAVAKCGSPASSTSRKLLLVANSSSHTSPITRARSQVGCSKDPGSLEGPALMDSNDSRTAGSTNVPPLDEEAKRESAEEKNVPPGEERAEAEGCEHTTTESLEEKDKGGVSSSFKGSNKLLGNDNVQTLKVIILSEQL